MNKSMSILIVGVILLAMSLIAFNQTFSEKTPDQKTEQAQSAEFQGAIAEIEQPAGGLLPLDNGTLKNPAEFPLPAMDGEKKLTDASQSTLSGTQANTGQLQTTSPIDSQTATEATTAEKITGASETPKTEAPKISANAEKKTSVAPKVTARPAKTAEKADKKSTEKNPSKTAAAPQKTPDGAGIKTKMTVSGKELRLRLNATAALVSKSFVLTAPDRIVLDLTGVWNVEDTKIPSNALVKGVRVGRQGGNTRIVVDLLKPVLSYNVAKVDKKTLELRIK